MADPGGKVKKLCNHYEVVADNSVKYVPPDVFCGIQILHSSVSASWPKLNFVKSECHRRRSLDPLVG